jgi:hypothetical protein
MSRTSERARTLPCAPPLDQPENTVTGAALLLAQPEGERHYILLIELNPEPNAKRRFRAWLGGGWFEITADHLRDPAKFRRSAMHWLISRPSIDVFRVIDELHGLPRDPVEWAAHIDPITARLGVAK